jgi:peptidyl-prolyl cis-trans isomerase A (cyclophilin A)
MLVALSTAGDEGVKQEFVPPDGLAPGWYANIETTMGRFVAQLLPDQAPQSVAHFAALAEGRLEWFEPATGKTEKGHYYDGIPVHLVDAGLRFEAGDRSGTGNGAPALFAPPEGYGPVDFGRSGRLGMTTTRSGKHSAVLFFATAVPMPWLNKSHPCFGAIIIGRDVVRRISEEKAYSNGRPVKPPVIERIRIFAIGDPPPLPEPVEFRGKVREAAAVE